jgi:hypothetical protein
MVLRNPDGTFTRATNEDQINAALAIGGHAFQVHTQAPNTQAFVAVLDRTFGKPTEYVKQEIELKTSQVDILKQRHARNRK